MQPYYGTDANAIATRAAHTASLTMDKPVDIINATIDELIAQYRTAGVLDPGSTDRTDSCAGTIPAVQTRHATPDERTETRARQTARPRSIEPANGL
nr:hypothetical protein [Burkholderia cenocepacia]